MKIVRHGLSIGIERAGRDFFAWDDFKLGLKHGNEFEKIAIYGNKNWQEITAKIGAWFISGEVKYFESEDDALAWLNE